MKQDKVFNYRMFMILPAPILFFASAHFSSYSNDNAKYVFIVLFILLGIVSTVLFFAQATFYIFDEEKLQIKYFFGFYENIYWKDLRRYHISITKHSASPGNLIFTFDYYSFPFGEGKTHPLCNQEIMATRKVKMLIRKYYKSDFDMSKQELKRKGR